MTKENLFRKAIANRQQTKSEEPDTADISPSTQAEVFSSPLAQPVQNVESTPVQVPISTEPKKRGRPATGKRSDDAWIGRTFYIRRETDLDVETELLSLKRQGIELDKSELVDKLLSAWVKWRQGENADFLLSEVSPIQKSKKL